MDPNSYCRAVALEVVPDGQLLGHAHAAVQLYGVLPDESRGATVVTLAADTALARTSGSASRFSTAR